MERSLGISQTLVSAAAHQPEDRANIFNDPARVSYVNGANVVGFVKVADAMLAQGVI